MKAQLYFIYDCLCPWSYAATRLVSEIDAQLADKVELVLLNNCRYENGELPSLKQAKQVEEISEIQLSQAFKNAISQPQASTLTANLMAWASRKAPGQALPLLQAIQHQWFEQGQLISEPEHLQELISKLKLSPPAKTLKTVQPSKDAAFDINEADSIAELTHTAAIPALLLAMGDNLVLLNHNYYLNQPAAIVDAVKLELNNAWANGR